MAQGVDVGDGLTSRHEHHHHIHPDLPAVMTRDETKPCQRRRQAIGEADPIGQEPHRDRPGQRHHTRPIRGD